MNSARIVFKRIIPSPARQWIWDHLRAPFNLACHIVRDGYRFWCHNLSKNGAHAEVLSKQITMYAHVLEKGLALRDSRPFFGRDVVMNLCKMLGEAAGREDVGSEVRQNALAVLSAYVAAQHINDSNEEETLFLEDIEKRLEAIADGLTPDLPRGGMVALRAGDVVRSAGGAASAIEARHSVRMYENRPVPGAVVRQCLEIASRSPSACNLQPARVYVFRDREQIRSILEVQGGARGFLSEVPLLFVLAYEISMQVGPRSRMQGFIDVGLLAQSLMLALLEQGIGTCPLNWAQEIATDRRLREVAGVKRSENVVMLISAGFLPKEFKCAVSSRLPLEQWVTVVSGGEV